jgi:hypothetical protein
MNLDPLSSARQRLTVPLHTAAAKTLDAMAGKK